MPVARGHHGGAAVETASGTEIYAIGGQLRHDTDPEEIAGVQAYDPAEDRWRAVAPLARPRSHFETATEVVAAADGSPRVLILGGIDRTSRFSRRLGLREVTVYDPGRDRWQELPPLPLGLCSPSTGVVGDRLYVLCGTDVLRRSGHQRMVLAVELEDLGLRAPGGS